MTSADTLQMWVIYDSPKDFPNGPRYVLRIWHLIGGREQAEPGHTASDDLEALRHAIPPGLFCLGRNPDDDPVILEVWI